MPVSFMIGVWKCHFDTWFCTRTILTYHVMFGGGYVGPDGGYGHVWDIHASVVHDRGLEMSS